jgi:hypothetical protein
MGGRIVTDAALKRTPNKSFSSSSSSPSSRGNGGNESKQRSSNDSNGHGIVLRRQLSRRRRLKGHQGKVGTAAWASDSNHIVSGSNVISFFTSYMSRELV